MVALGTAAITLLMPNEYESRMKILVKNTRSDVPITPEQNHRLNRQQFRKRRF
jgi:uncharacterized protein involved in exopolysaccharide biosynthesis